MPKFGRWVEVHGYVTAGGDPVFECGHCHGSTHVHGVEHRKIKLLCDHCGRINIYPWEEAYEIGSSLWEDDEE